ncbi:MAG: D-alanyl-D-alanine carboxypeptidase [Actinomycetota bacterium]|nr:D-alanyl-D-alanine carboxypeptidase [Actinomycetota bacterium]
MAVAVGGHVIYAHDGLRRRTPASNEKLVLTMALFDQLGPWFRIRTTAAALLARGGRVQGDLWILGHGDPTMTSNDAHYWGPLRSTTLERLAAHIRHAGIKEITGRVMAADDYFAHDFAAPGWQPFVPRNYVELPAALSLNGNFHVSGHPERAVARALNHQLETSGINVGGNPAVGIAPARLVPVASVISSPLSRIVANMDGTSNNFFAEVLGKLLGAKTYGPPGTIRKGARAIEAWAGRNGVKMSAYDSSGLSYKDKISPRGIVKLLAAAEERRWGQRLRRDLPAPGQGTLEGRLAGLRVHAKTGTLFNSDSALSGWVRRVNSGPWIEFSILDRNAPKALEDSIVAAIAHAPMAAVVHPSLRSTTPCR